MSDELTALKEKIDRDGREQFGASPNDYNRVFEIYEAQLQEANDALIDFDGELLALEIMKLSDSDLQAAIKHDRIVIDERHHDAIERAKASIMVPPESEPVIIGIDLAAADKHERHVQSDEVFCPKCCKRWGIDEDEPVCGS